MYKCSCCLVLFPTSTTLLVSVQAIALCGPLRSAVLYQPFFWEVGGSNAKNFASRLSKNPNLIVKLTNFWFEFLNKVRIFMIGKAQIFRKCKKPDIETLISYTL